MSSAKNKYSNKLHRSKTHFSDPHTKTPIQKTVFTVIILTVIVVFISLFCSIMFDTEHVIKSKISRLATDYYENYFYPDLSSNSKDISNSLSRYTDIGLARVSLRQLILSNSNLLQQDINYLQKYCDENATFVQFFPTEPFNQNNYRIEFTYSCSF